LHDHGIASRSALITTKSVDKTKVTWRFERIATGANYQYAVCREKTNIQVAKNVMIDTPQLCRAFRSAPGQSPVRKSLARVCLSGPGLHHLLLSGARTSSVLC